MQTEELEFLVSSENAFKQVSGVQAACLLSAPHGSCGGNQNLWGDLKGLVLVHLGL